MGLTKTQIKILEIFTSKITQRFSIKQISELLKKPYPLIYYSIIDLLKQELVIKDEKGYIHLNYAGENSNLCYIESIRKSEFLKKNKTLSLFVKDVISNNQLNFFIFLIFGSSVHSTNFRDVDVLIIVEKKDEINLMEKFVLNISKNFTLKFDISVIDTKSFHEMVLRRSEKNIINESLNNHIILFGAENYYKILKNVR